MGRRYPELTVYGNPVLKILLSGVKGAEINRISDLLRGNSALHAVNR